VTEAGRLELLPFLREQAVSITAHRFGTPIRTPVDDDEPVRLSGPMSPSVG
jgi:RHH-type proline utilization regulon transcriptional repressor/proline dehydrogenase/delta 1-pyrroline-5-carboxylate dehydrogenase